MKKISILFLILVLSSCTGMMGITGPDATVSALSYSNVTEFPDIDKNTLYVESNKWAVDAFNDAESVVQFQDKESGVIKGKYSSTFKNGIYNYSTRTTFEIAVKDNKIKIDFKDPMQRLLNDDLGNRYNQEYRLAAKALIINYMRDEWKTLEATLIKAINEGSNW